jgi:hypothetical protein
MGINLGGRDIGVTQHALQAPEIRSAFQQMCGESMTKDVRRQIVKNSRLLPVARQQLPKGLPCHCPTAIGHK